LGARNSDRPQAVVRTRDSIVRSSACVMRLAIALNVLKTIGMILANAFSRCGGHGDAEGTTGTATIGLRHKPLAYQRPTSQRLLLSAPGCRLSGYPGKAAPNRNRTLKVVPFIVGSHNDRSAIGRQSLESNPDRIEGLMGVSTWGSRVRDNPRLREVSPTGKFLGGRVCCCCELDELASEPRDRSFA